MAVRRSFARRRKPDTTRSGEVTAWPGLKWAVTDEVGEPIMRRIQQVVRAAAGLVVVAGAVALWTSDHPASKRPGPNRHPRVAERAAPALAAFDGNHAQVLNAYANLPVAFIENRGQTDNRVRYYAQGSRYGFYLTRDQVVLSLVEGSEALGARASGTPAAVTAPEVEERE